MTRHDALVSAILELIDRCGVNVPLTTEMIARTIGIDNARALALLLGLRGQGDIARHEHAGSTIWIRPRHREQWKERTKSSAPKK
jgi:hypothetical protein